jgi:hypothetical protein
MQQIMDVLHFLTHPKSKPQDQTSCNPYDADSCIICTKSYSPSKSSSLKQSPKTTKERQRIQGMANLRTQSVQSSSSLAANYGIQSNSSGKELRNSKSLMGTMLEIPSVKDCDNNCETLGNASVSVNLEDTVSHDLVSNDNSENSFSVHVTQPTASSSSKQQQQQQHSLPSPSTSSSLNRALSLQSCAHTSTTNNNNNNNICTTTSPSNTKPHAFNSRSTRSLVDETVYSPSTHLLLTESAQDNLTESLLSEENRRRSSKSEQTALVEHVDAED